VLADFELSLAENRKETKSLRDALALVDPNPDIPAEVDVTRVPPKSLSTVLYIYRFVDVLHLAQPFMNSSRRPLYLRMDSIGTSAAKQVSLAIPLVLNII